MAGIGPGAVNGGSGLLSRGGRPRPAVGRRNAPFGKIEQLVQINEGQSFTYDRNTLVKMLDEALAQSRPRAPQGS